MALKDPKMVRINGSLHERLSAVADSRLVSPSLIAEAAITEWLDSHERTDPLAPVGPEGPEF